jgi:4-hydroxy-3-polyprenylbenzoate decarboxylase
MELVVAVTGASGAIYAKRFLEVAQPPHCRHLHLVVSETGLRLLSHELGLDAPQQLLASSTLASCVYSNDDLLAPIASGSAHWDAMVVVPCSAGTLGRIASGVSDSLITRAADVALKERRPLILVLRETPLSQIHLRNMLTLAQAGAVILPASPAFYNSPGSIADLVDFIVQRICDALNWKVELCPRWGGRPL